MHQRINVAQSSRLELLAGTLLINPIALRKAEIAYNCGLSECSRVKGHNIIIATAATNRRETLVLLI